MSKIMYTSTEWTHVSKKTSGKQFLTEEYGKRFKDLTFTGIFKGKHLATRRHQTVVRYLLEVDDDHMANLLLDLDLTLKKLSNIEKIWTGFQRKFINSTNWSFVIYAQNPIVLTVGTRTQFNIHDVNVWFGDQVEYNYGVELKIRPADNDKDVVLYKHLYNDNRFHKTLKTFKSRVCILQFLYTSVSILFSYCVWDS